MQNSVCCSNCSPLPSPSPGGSSRGGGGGGGTLFLVLQKNRGANCWVELQGRARIEHCGVPINFAKMLCNRQYLYAMGIRRELTP